MSAVPIIDLAIEQTKDRMAGPLAQAGVTTEIAFVRGAVWAVNRITIEQIADEIAGHPIGSGYYQTTVGVDEAREIAEDVLALLRGEEGR